MDIHMLRKKFEQYLIENNIWWSPERLEYTVGTHFRNFNLHNRSILEIGAGHGIFSVWCITRGATKVVAIEPEASGSTLGIRSEFEKLKQTIKFDNKLIYLGITLNEYLNEFNKCQFDFILMHSVINHLNEKATEKLHLHSAEAERNYYNDVFKNLYNILKPNGILSIHDVGRRNFWGDLNVRNPFGPTQEYNKHQQPKIWKKLLCQNGFEFMDLLWFAPFRLRKMRRFYWWLPAYLTSSGFVLRCKKY